MKVSNCEVVAGRLEVETKPWPGESGRVEVKYGGRVWRFAVWVMCCWDKSPTRAPLMMQSGARYKLEMLTGYATGRQRAEEEDWHGRRWREGTKW